MTGTTNATEVPALAEGVQAAADRHDIVVIGASAGGVDALRRLIAALEMPGRPSRFACPDCGGSLWDVGDKEPGKFRCRVGHS